MRRLIGTIDIAALAVAISLLVVMIVTVLAQVAFRYVFNLPLPWTEEASRLALIGAVYAALPAAYVRGEHIVVDFFAGLMPRAVLLVYVLVLKAISFFVVAFFAYGAFLQARETWNMTFIAIRALPVGSMYLFQGVALVLFALTILVTWRDPDVYIAPHRDEGDV